MTGADRLPPPVLSLRVNFDMEMDVVVDEAEAEEAEEFTGAVVAAVGGAIEFQNTLAGEVLAVVLRGDEQGEFQRAVDAPEDGSFHLLDDLLQLPRHLRDRQPPHFHRAVGLFAQGDVDLAERRVLIRVVVAELRAAAFLSLEG
jgi:hypothetical protein